MAPFYAYARSILDGTNGIVWRYLLTFASRDDADEWWRVISHPPSPTAGIFQRITPQYYTFKQTDVPDFILAQNFAGGKTFQDEMFFTLLSDRDGRIQSTFPQKDITDHISGKWFYIQSRSDPDRFWYSSTGRGECLVCGLPECNDVHVSTERRSRFCVQAPKVSQDDNSQVIIIRGDQITIAPNKEYILEITDNNQLKAQKSLSIVQDIVFNDFKDRFSVHAKKLADGIVVEYVVPVDRGTGEVWELAA